MENTARLLVFDPTYMYKGEVIKSKYTLKFKELLKNIATVVYSDISEGNAWIINHDLKYEDFYYHKEQNDTLIKLNVTLGVEVKLPDNENLDDYFDNLKDFISRWLNDFNPEDKPYNMCNDKKTNKKTKVK